MYANGNSFGWTPPGDIRPHLEAPLIRMIAGPGKPLEGVSWG